MKRCRCSECGKLRQCFKRWLGGHRWTWTCDPCMDIIDAEEDGYVIQIC